MSEMVAKVDVVMTPAIPAPAPRDLNTTGDAAFQVPWTAASLPTVVVSTGLSELGMPMAVQFGGPWAEEGKVLGAAQWCEADCGLGRGAADRLDSKNPPAMNTRTRSSEWVPTDQLE